MDNLGDPEWTVLNRVKPAHVPGCFKMFKTTGTHREQPGRLSNTVINREDAGSNRVSTGTASGGYRRNPGTSVSPPRYTVRFHCLCICNKMQNKSEKSLLLHLK